MRTGVCPGNTAPGERVGDPAIQSGTGNAVVGHRGRTKQEPIVLPSKIPNLLVNGASGIGVSLATNIPPHNLVEVVDAMVAFINNPDITTDELSSKLGWKLTVFFSMSARISDEIGASRASV